MCTGPACSDGRGSDTEQNIQVVFGPLRCGYRHPSGVLLLRGGNTLWSVAGGSGPIHQAVDFTSGIFPPPSIHLAFPLLWEGEKGPRLSLSLLPSLYYYQVSVPRSARPASRSFLSLTTHSPAAIRITRRPRRLGWVGWPLHLHPHTSTSTSTIHPSKRYEIGLRIGRAQVHLASIILEEPDIKDKTRQDEREGHANELRTRT